MKKNLEMVVKATALTIAISTTSAQAWVIDGIGDFKFDKLNDSVFVMHGPKMDPAPENHGFIINPSFIEGEKGIILIDPASSKFVGENILAEIEKVTTKPVVAVINTHVHGDHWLGNQAVKQKYPEAKFYAHMNMISEAESGEAERWAHYYAHLSPENAGTEALIPDYSVEHGDVINIEGQKLIFHSPFPSTHSSSDIMIEHVASKTLFTGDNALNNRMGRFDGKSSMLDNIEILKYAKGLDIELFVPGHGESGTVDTAINPYLNYLTVVESESRKGYEEDLSDYEIKPGVSDLLKDYHSWDGFEAALGKHINKMLLEIEERDM